MSGLPGAVCTCGIIVFGPLPMVQAFLRCHPVTADPAHCVSSVLPDTPLYDRIDPALARVRWLALEWSG